MARMARSVRDRFDDIKSNIVDSNQYFKHNYERFNNFMRFIYETSLTEDDRVKLQMTNKPQVEFNVLEAYINNRIGQFANHEPGVKVRAAPGIPVSRMSPSFTQTLDILQAHFQYICESSNDDGLKWKLLKDMLAGGYSVAEVYTDYVSSRSFEQNIYIDRVFDPTMCGFDPLARKSHKGDGRYCYQLFPRTVDEFVSEYGSDAAKDCRFSRTLGDFNWDYCAGDEKIVLEADYFEKKIKEAKLLKLSNGETMTTKEYEMFLEKWEMSGAIEQPPMPVGKGRKTEIYTIERFKLCGNEILKHEEMNFSMLPLVFFDGNSAYLRNGTSGAAYQMTRPYVYQAKDVQRLKNVAGQAVAYEIEAMQMHKWIVPLEGLDERYLDEWKNPQIADVLKYRSFVEGSDGVQIPQPREVQRTPTPPIVQQTFMGADQVTQTILGAYDAQMGIQSKEISGAAIRQGDIHSSASSSPYMLGFVDGWNRLLHIVADLIPKYYVTPRSIPIVKDDGKREYIVINDKRNPNSAFFHYDPNDLDIEVSAGVSSTAQKQIALEQITAMCRVSKQIADFINANGLEVILDNMDIRGIDQLKRKAEEWQEQQRQMQQMQQQQAMQNAQRMAQQPTPQELELMKIQQKGQIDSAKVAIDKQKADAATLEAAAKIQATDKELQLKAAEVDAENARSAVESINAITNHVHERRMDQAKHGLEVHKHLSNLARENINDSQKELSNGETDNEAAQTYPGE